MYERDMPYYWQVYYPGIHLKGLKNIMKQATDTVKDHL
jgi:hypothetical protein